MSTHFQPISQTQFSRRQQDAQDPRLLMWLETDPAASAQWTILGYPDDLGITMNGGRAGAALAPDLVRKYLFGMTPPSLKKQFSIRDLGNLILSKELADRHTTAENAAAEVFLHGQKLITIGGGHDYGFSDASAFIKVCFEQKTPKPLVMNFDAHLDVRPLDRGHHSGTPFRRLLEAYRGQFDFYEIGLQPQCNSVAHREWAQNWGADLTDLSVVRKSGLGPVLCEILNSTGETAKKRPLWISMDMDAFSSAWAPGCSQSFATGLEPQEVLEAIDFLQTAFSVRGIGVYEIAPPMDQDDRTAKLGAQLIYRTLFPEVASE